MRRNSEPAALVDYVADFACRFSLEVRKLRPDAEKMAIGGRHFHSWENEKIIDRQSIQSHQALLQKVIDRIACVVIGDGDAVQAFGTRGCNHVFRAGDTVPGKKGMRVKVDVKRHGSKSRVRS